VEVGWKAYPLRTQEPLFTRDLQFNITRSFLFLFSLFCFCFSFFLGSENESLATPLHRMIAMSYGNAEEENKKFAFEVSLSVC
jgi:hypothetical protein